MTSRPLSALPGAIARVACSGETHEIGWEAGDLVALNHGDPEGERALAALGGQSCACLDVLGAWTRQRGNAALLSALRRAPQDPVHTEGFRPGPFAGYGATTGPRNLVSARRGGSMWRGVTAAGGLVSTAGVSAPGGFGGPNPNPSSTPEDDMVLLASLGYELSVRMAATVTAALLNHPQSPEGSSPRPALEASLFGRVLVALRTWLGNPELELALEVAEPDAESGIGWESGALFRLVLPLEWVTTVWGADLSVVAGRFCLGVAEWNGTRTTLMSVGSDLGPPRPLTIEIS